jgi:hypothetical protein
VAFNDIGKKGLDKSDMHRWSTSDEAKAFVDEINVYKKQAFAKLLKEGEKKHSQNAECYKAYERVITLLNEASKL